MKSRALVLLMLILLLFLLNGCTPAEIKFAEEVADEAIEEDLKSR